MHVLVVENFGEMSSIWLKIYGRAVCFISYYFTIIFSSEPYFISDLFPLFLPPSISLIYQQLKFFSVHNLISNNSASDMHK